MSLRRVGQAALVLGGVLVFLLGFTWLALPGILQSQAQKFVAEKSGHKLSLAKPEINPLALSLRLRELKLEDPEGAPLLAFRELFIDLSSASIATRGIVIDELKLDGLAISLILSNDAQAPMNWSRLLAAFARKDEKKPDAPPPRIDINHLVLSGAQADIADRRTTPAFVSRVDAFDLELKSISTKPDDSGQFTLAAHTTFGAQLEWKGTATLNPLGSSGKLSLRGVDLGKLAPLLAARIPPELGFAPPEGVAGLAVDYRLGHANGKLALALDPFSVELANLVLRKPKAAGAPAIGLGVLALTGGRFDLATQQLAFQSLALKDISLESGTGKQHAKLVALPELGLAATRIDLAQHNAEVGAVSLKNGRIALRRDAGGAIDLVAALKALGPDAAATKAAAPKSASEAAATAAPWRYAVERVALAGFGIAFHDESMTPALQLGLEDIAIETSGLSEKLDRPLPLKAGLRVASGGRLAVEGKLVPATAAIDLQLKLDDLTLKPAQALIGKHAALDLASGRISAAGKVQHDAKASSYKGSFGVNELRLNEAGSDKVFLAWKYFGTRQLEATPQKLQIGELMLEGLDTQLLIAKDKSTNFQRVLRKADAPAPAAGEAKTDAPAAAAVVPAPTLAPASAPGAAADAKPAPAFLVNIDRLRFREGELDFADESLLFPFGTRIHKLRGSIAGLSSRPGSAGQLELDGEVDDYGLARAVGQVDPFDPTGFTEIKLIFRNLEMNRLTPYSATFAGRRIDSGKLSLDLEYNIRKRQLQSNNQVVIDKLVLGERVQSPTAKDLPLDLAIALLEDSDGRIDLGLPITGSLDDPQFSFGGIVWKVIANVLTKIVTAPFRALGALFGGGDEKLENIAFEAGARRLTPPEREKLVKLAAALNKRPALALSISGTWNAADRVALQDRQLRRSLLERSGQKLDPQGDPGPISTRAPDMQTAIEDLFAERFGKAELAGFKQGFRSANPGQLEEGVAGKMMSRLTGLVRPPRALNESEVGALKGADFHAVLYQRLREKEVVSDESLQQLAQARGEATLATLKDAKAPVDRVKVSAAEKIAGEDREVALKLGLDKAAR